ncbi:MAG: hypothetical protein LBD69_04600 [Puniceicoccales bacterium]|nr:hypothetical protein [Puniceicoccales bacterium]
MQALIAGLDKHHATIAFIKCRDNEPEDFKNLNNNYAFQSESTISAPGDSPIYITVKNPPPTAETRSVFDGTEIKEQTITRTFLNGRNLEAYLISHELAHVVSFLSSGITNKDEWNARKQNWAEFFQEDRMQPIYNTLHDGGWSDENIHNSFKKLFTNTEEARNLLGVIPGKNKGEYIGEFYLFTSIIILHYSLTLTAIHP